MLTFRAKDLIGLLALAVYATAWYIGPPAPKPIKAVPLTECKIKEGIEIEHRDRAIKKSVAAVRNVFRMAGCRQQVHSEIIGRTAYEYELSPRLLAAVVYVESGCVRGEGAVSSRNSVGLMQVNPRVWGHRNELRDPERNLRIGAKILKGYINQFGLVEGLHHYNGLGNPTNSYAERVLAVGGIKL